MASQPATPAQAAPILKTTVLSQEGKPATALLPGFEIPAESPAASGALRECSAPYPHLHTKLYTLHTTFLI